MPQHISLQEGDKGKLEEDRKEEGDVTSEAEIEVMDSQDKKCWQPCKSRTGKGQIVLCGL